MRVFIRPVELGDFREPGNPIGENFIDITDSGFIPVIGDQINFSELIKPEWFHKSEDWDDMDGNYAWGKVENRCLGKSDKVGFYLQIECSNL